jgi:N6-L-threonylcarbamoyladenine synthase
MGRSRGQAPGLGRVRHAYRTARPERAACRGADPSAKRGPGVRPRDLAARGGFPVILALETSCDETAAALVTDDGHVRANVVASQAELHARYGGVVPEVASRRHLELVIPVVREALREAETRLDELDRVAVTTGPGLIGALLVGVAAAKGIAWGRGLPLVPVDHLHGHVASLFLEPDPIAPPFLCLLASGGHTLLLDVADRSGFRMLGTTLDDAAGEAFDKGARLLGLGYPGGAEIDRLAREGDPEAHRFPVARVQGLDFSFSGLKTALLYAVRDLPAAELEARRADLAASFQRAIVRALVERTIAAAERTGATRIAVVGGVAANSELRAALPDAALAPLPLCTDNAAMIGSAARFVPPIPSPDYLPLDARA